VDDVPTAAFVKALVVDEPDSSPMPLTADQAVRGVDLSLEGSGASFASPASNVTEGPWERTNRFDRPEDDEPDTVPQALMIEPVADHELIVLDLEMPGGLEAEAEAGDQVDLPIVIEEVQPLSPPPLLWSTSEMGALDEPALEPLAVTFRNPSEFASLDEGEPTRAAGLEPDALMVPASLDVPLDVPLVAELAELPAEAAAQSEPEPEPDEPEEEPVKVVGDLRIGIPLFNIYLNEADEQSRRLSQTMAEWLVDTTVTVPADAVALSHSLAGNSATVGYVALSQLARSLEHALERAQTRPAAPETAVQLFHEASEEIRRLLHQFAAGFLKSPPPELQAQLDAFEPPPLEPHQPAATPHLRLVQDGDAPDDFAPSQSMTLGLAEFKALAPLAGPADLLPGARPDPGPAQPSWRSEADIDGHDHVDPDLFPIFEEEAQELLPELATQTRQWLDMPDNPAAAAACMRTLHTFKGGARLAGAMRLGELAHQLESSIERLLAAGAPNAADVAPLEARVDRLIEVFDALRQQDASAYEAQARQLVDTVHHEQEALATPDEATAH